MGCTYTSTGWENDLKGIDRESEKNPKWRFELEPEVGAGDDDEGPVLAADR